MVRKTVVTPANVLDFKSARDSMLGDEKELFADKGYEGARKILSKTHPNCKLNIMHKRQRAQKGCKHLELDVFRSFNNREYAKVRSRVEHVFCSDKKCIQICEIKIQRFGES